MIEHLGNEADLLAKEYAASQDIYVKASRMYWKQTEATLASRLHSGKACPVCGSKEHPDPAKMPRGEEISAAALDHLFQNADRLHRSMNEKYSEIHFLRIAEQRQQEELHKHGKYTSDDVRHAREGLEAARNSKDRLKNFLEMRTNSTEHLGDLRKERDVLLAQKEQMVLLSERCQDAENTLREQILKLDPDALYKVHSDDRFLSEAEYAEIEQEISEYETQLSENTALVQVLSKQLVGKVRPQAALLQAQYDASAAALKKMEQEDLLLQNTQEKLEQIRLRYQLEYEKFSEYSKAAEKSMRFYRMLRGSNGIGLQRYVLGAMLSVVTEDANRLLQNVHGGRYQIFRTDAAAGLTRKSGLELEVFDRWSGERRSVASLSGGEKFLVALSLSIGLSYAVQSRAAANKLGAVFIDEGFGTLDRSSMQDALQILSSIGVSNGLIGIISHVQALQETISTGIVVQKGSRGSTLRVICD